VLEQCGGALLAEMRQGVRPRDGVVAGVRFNTVGRPRATDQSRVRCTLCRKPPPRGDAGVEADIAAYARRKGAVQCGTAAGYDAHFALGERPCRRCSGVGYRRLRA
jgi:hypothetical protein